MIEIPEGAQYAVQGSGSVDVEKTQKREREILQDMQEYWEANPSFRLMALEKMAETRVSDAEISEQEYEGESKLSRFVRDVHDGDAESALEDLYNRL